MQQADLARERAKMTKDSEGAPMFGKASKDQQHKIDVDQADLKKKEKVVSRMHHFCSSVQPHTFRCLLRNSVYVCMRVSSQLR